MAAARRRTTQLSMNLQETPAPRVEGDWRCTRCGHVFHGAAAGWTRGLDPRFRYGRCRHCQGKRKTPTTFVLVAEQPNRAAGERGKEVGMRAAEFASIASGWVELFDVELARLAAEGVDFTSEDVTAIVGQPPSSGAVGARMNAAARRGLIRQVGHRKAARANQHATEIKLWRGAGNVT